MPKTIECSDGPRRTIDIRDFVTQYSAYSAQFEATIGNKAKFAGKIDPMRLQQLSESVQHANEFRKYLVAGYNSCAITKADYALYGRRFHELDSLSRQIDILVSQRDMRGGDGDRLKSLVERYMELSKAVSK